MTNERDIFDVGEEKIRFINDFLISQCVKADPSINIETLSKSGRLTALQMENEQYQYFLDGKLPLLFIDLKLLIDGT